MNTQNQPHTSRTNPIGFETLNSASALAAASRRRRVTPRFFRNGQRFSVLFFTLVLMSAIAAHASISYVQDTNVHDFTSTVQTYATFISGTGSPYTPTSANLESGSPNLVIGEHTAPVIVDFGAGNQVSKILVFSYIDHIGYAWDAYQPFRIYGSNDDVNFTQLSDALTASPGDVNGVDQHFMLDTWTGTPPTLVNNTVSSNGLGYEAYFDFSSSGSFRYYKFLYSTLTQNNIGQGEWEEELAGVAAASPATTPEPSSLLLTGSGVLGLAGVLRRKLLR
jgi:hypothetical protein